MIVLGCSAPQPVRVSGGRGEESALPRPPQRVRGRRLGVATGDPPLPQAVERRRSRSVRIHQPRARGVLPPQIVRGIAVWPPRCWRRRGRRAGPPAASGSEVARVGARLRADAGSCRMREPSTARAPGADRVPGWRWPSYASFQHEQRPSLPITLPMNPGHAPPVFVPSTGAR